MARLLPYNAYYENSRGDIIRLDELPFVMDTGDLFNAEWKFSKAVRPFGEGGRLLAAKRADSARTITVNVIADTAHRLSKLLERMAEVFDYDVVSLKAGRLWINGQYMTCWCQARNKELSRDFVTNASVSISVHPETPVWCREVSCKMAAEGGVEGHRYPYAYPHRYGDSRPSARIVNSHFAPSPMRIIFRGPARNPAVYINGGRVGVNITLTDGECAVIEQMSGEVYKIKPSGEKINCFDSRVRNGLAFKFAPAGESTAVAESGTDVEIILIEQRSEPSWTLS